MSKLTFKDKITIIQRVVTIVTSLVSTLALVMIAYHLSYAKSFLLNASCHTSRYAGKTTKSY